MLSFPFESLAASATSIFEFASRSLVFRMGERSSGFYHVLEGEVHLHRITRNGDAVVIHRAFSGDYFAEASLFSETYHCDAIATKPTRLVKIDRQTTLQLMRGNARFSQDLASYLAGRVQSYRSLLELRSIRSAEERVLAAVTDGWLEGSVVSFASQIGLTQEATYRALSALVRKGRLSKSGRGQYEPADKV